MGEHELLQLQIRNLQEENKELKEEYRASQSKLEGKIDMLQSKITDMDKHFTNQITQIMTEAKTVAEQRGAWISGIIGAASLLISILFNLL